MCHHMFKIMTKQQFKLFSICLAHQTNMGLLPVKYIVTILLQTAMNKLLLTYSAITNRPGMQLIESDMPLCSEWFHVCDKQ